jgi:alpha,alpha-trehalase
VEFVNSDFGGEGLELEQLTLPNFNQTPAFLSDVTNDIVKAWVQTVHGYWTQLIRRNYPSIICQQGSDGSCESSLIPLNHTFVVPGNDYRYA